MNCGATLAELSARSAAETPSHSTHAACVAASLAVLYAVDLCLKRTPCAPDKIRWFALHCITNLVIAACCLPDLLLLARAPLCASALPMTTWLPSYFSFSLHLLHIVAYPNRTADLVHHVLFGGGFALLNFSCHFGPMVNALLFFITGLPGGLTYLMLVRVKLNRMAALEEKRITSLLNTWLRAPGLVCVAAAQYVCVVSGLALAPWPFTATSVLLAFGNGVYYGAQAVDNYAESRSKSSSSNNGGGGGSKAN